MKQQQIKQHRAACRAAVASNGLSTGLAATATEYMDEGEHQDGIGYWFNFKTPQEAVEDFQLYAANRERDEHQNPMSDIPPAACPKCGGWSASGGMAQYRNERKPVNGRTGCKCHWA